MQPIFNLLHPHYFNIIAKRLYYRITTLISTLKLRLWGVSVGKGCKFNGAIVARIPGKGEIIIGKNCIFNSNPKSNLIGLNHPCMLSLMNRNAKITIGDNCGFSGTTIRCAKKITIGNNVNCGANTIIIDTDEHAEDPRAGMDAEIFIGNNVWLGMNVIILKGVRIGDNSMIGAGSIVTKNIPSGVIAAGVPCKVIKEITVHD